MPGAAGVHRDIFIVSVEKLDYEVVRFAYLDRDGAKPIILPSVFFARTCKNLTGAYYVVPTFDSLAECVRLG